MNGGLPTSYYVLLASKLCDVIYLGEGNTILRQGFGTMLQQQATCIESTSTLSLLILSVYQLGQLSCTESCTKVILGIIFKLLHWYELT